MLGFLVFTSLVALKATARGIPPMSIIPLKTPMDVDVHPLLPFNSTGIAPLCAREDVQPGDVINDWIGTSLSGLHKLTKLYNQTSAAAKNKPLGALRYAEARKMKLNAQSDNSTPIVSAMAECITRKVELTTNGVGTAMCSCLADLEPADYCAAIDILAQKTHCHDNYRAKIDAASYCPKILTPSLGVELSHMCSGWIAGTVSAVDLNLYTLNFPNTVPDVVDTAVMQQETRTYYLAYKAVEKLHKWADAHSLCSKHDPNGMLKGELKNLKEILPGYETIMQLWSTEATTSIPLGVIARRGEVHLVVFRDALTNFGGSQLMQHVPAYEFYDVVKGVQVHRGIASNWDALRTLVVEYFKEWYNTRLANPKNPRIVFVGGGELGSGTAIMAAIETHMNLPGMNDKFKTKIAYDVVTFGAPPVINYEAIAYLKANINIRNVVSKQDGGHSFPCEMMRACNGNYAVYTGENNMALGPFAKPPGQVEIDTTTFPDDVWRDPAARYSLVAQTHCALQCYFSEVCSDMTDSKCTREECGLFL